MERQFYGVMSVYDDDVDFIGAGSNASWDHSDSKFRINDNTKISFGNGLDLEIYHDGSNSYIKDSGTGNLLIQAEPLVAIQDTSGNNSAIFNDGGTVELYHNNSLKFTTQSYGIDVTGEVQCDSLDVDGAANIQGVLTMQSYIQGTGTLNLYGNSSSSVGLALDTDGNITIPDKVIHAGDTDTAIRFPAANTVTIETAGTERLRITSAGNVGIGSTIPTQLLDVLGNAIVSGVVTATKFVGDGSELTGIAAGGGSGEFNTGITSTVQATPLSF